MLLAFRRRPATATLILLFIAFFAAETKAATLTGIRDGVVYARMPTGASLEMHYRPVWGSDASGDLFFFQAPDGTVLERIKPTPGNGQGRRLLFAAQDTGDYRFEVTGYSHREVRLTAPAAVPLVFEPAKVHFSLNAASGQVLYFNVPAPNSNAAFSLCARYEKRGIRGLRLVSPTGRTYQLNLTRGVAYDATRYDTIAISGSGYETGVWRLSFEGSGKAAFWLDGIPGYFALKPEDLFIPEFREGSLDLEISDITPGREKRLPLLGVSAISVTRYPEYEEALRELGPEAINSYLLFNKNPKDARGLSAREVREFAVILDPQPSTLYRPGELAEGLSRFTSTDAKKGQRILVALYDEPNLRFSDSATFLDNYRPLLEAFTAMPGYENCSVALPESSLMQNGPFLDRAGAKKGIDWTLVLLRDPACRALLKEPYAVSWHEWMHRDLLRTEAYADIINKTHSDLNALTTNFTLHITQTNISSGPDSSPYDMDSFFASLWLASAYIHAANTGKLASFHWFAFTDEPGLHKKGLIAVKEDGKNREVRRRPVWYLFDFLLRHKQAILLPTDYARGEIAALAVTNEDSTASGVFIVNQSRRKYTLSLRGKGMPLKGGGYMHSLTAESPEQAAIVARPDISALSVPPESISFVELQYIKAR